MASDVGPRTGRTGKCLCGAVSYTAERISDHVLQCHCENCRRLSGNYVAAVRADTADLRIDSPTEAFQWHDLGYARYGFCRSCGSTLVFHPSERPESTSVMVGTLDDPSGLIIHEVWFADEAQPHNQLPHGVAHHAGNG
ncbi:MAG: GFA family protein [Acidimicrobiales bacterium]